MISGADRAFDLVWVLIRTARLNHSTVSSTIRRARQGFPGKNKKTSRLSSFERPFQTSREMFSRTVSVSSFLLPFSSLPSIFPPGRFSLEHRYSGPVLQMATNILYRHHHYIKI